MVNKNMIKLTVSVLIMLLSGCASVEPWQVASYMKNFPNGYWVLTNQEPVDKLRWKPINSIIVVEDDNNTVQGINQFSTCDTFFSETGTFSGKFPELIMTMESGTVKHYRFLGAKRNAGNVAFYFDIQPPECDPNAESYYDW